MPSRPARVDEPAVLNRGVRRFLPYLRVQCRRLAPWSAWIAISIFCLASCARLIAGLFYQFRRLGELGYGDLYVLQSVRRFQETGVIYPHLAGQLPTGYGPLLYLALAIPGRAVTVIDAELGRRLIVAGAFLLCIALVASLTRALLPHRRVWLWSVPLALSFPELPNWALQLRGDFMAIGCSLLALRLLLSRSLAAALAAGVCAGLATQFKYNYLAALAAGALWLAINRRWKHLAAFVAGGAVASAGLYGVFILREPDLLANLLSYRRPVLDYVGAFHLIVSAVGVPVLLLGFSALPFLRWRRGSGWMLLAMFVAVSLGVASLIEIQAGGALNYFFEAQLGIVPFASLAMLKLRRSGYSFAGLCLAGVLLVAMTPNIAYQTHKNVHLASESAPAYDRQMLALREAFQHRHVLSLAPEVAFFSPEVILSEPWLASYLERSGSFDLDPLARQIRERQFDVVVTRRTPALYRGVPLLSPTLRPAIAEAYRPYCAMDEWVIFWRRDSTVDEAFSGRLAALGCDAAACVNGPTCRSW